LTANQTSRAGVPATWHAGTIFAAVLLTLAITVAACSQEDVGERSGMGSHMSGSPASTASPGLPKDIGSADAVFLQELGALGSREARMSRLALRFGSPGIRALGRRIRTSQRGRDRLVRACLTDWSDQHPGRMMTGAGATHLRHGTMSSRAMGTLALARGAQFDARFLSMMIDHHRAMVSAAEAELDHGANPRTRRLAGMIERQQGAELTMMQKMDSLDHASASSP
jgi:uncharacterized protein (DUF305 family)